MPEQIKEPLKIVEGRQLSSVEFVQNYVQLRFDGPCITAITHPRIKIGEHWFDWITPGYRDALCEQIGQIVRHASTVEGKEILMEFKGGAWISISLKFEDYQGPEAAHLDVAQQPTCVW